MASVALLQATVGCSEDENDSSGGAGQSSGGSSAGGSSASGGSGGDASGGDTGGACPSCNRATFTTLKLERNGGLGFCIEAGQFVSADIVRDDATGEVSISGSRYVGCGGDTCEGTVDDHTEPVPSTVLDGADAEQLSTLIDALPQRACYGVNPNCDYCLDTRIEVGGCVYRQNACSCADPPCIDGLDELASFIDGLALDG